MALPVVFNENSLFDDFDDLERAFFPVMPVDRSVFGHRASRLMRTDVRETPNSYEFDIDLPGFAKNEVNAVLKDGYLTVSASKAVSHDEKKEGRYIRRERSTGACSRSFYVGDNVTEADIKAKFENGILQISVPKKEAAKPEEKAIAIE